ncbi:MAG: cysteine hydrolase [Anaerolineaceae bacterium]|nr:cysteine hydrolase [Anaerolineaceae bacterium]
MDKQAENYLGFLDRFYLNLQEMSVDTLMDDPAKTAIVCVDVSNAFCRTGNLASERVAAIIRPIIELFTLARKKGLEEIILLQDCHTSNAKEFAAFSEHAVCGTVESETVDEIKSLSFYGEMKIIQKNSINPAQNTEFGRWLEEHPKVNTFIVVGDCTDLCIYQTAMHLKTDANARDIERRVIIPEVCVNTYDLPTEIAKDSPAQPHPADLLHKLFLHHMRLNGIEICKKLI